MNATIKQILIVSAKNAVNAILVNVSASEVWPQLFNFHSSAGWVAVAKLIGITVAVREATIWGPVLLKWSTTNAQPPED